MKRLIFSFFVFFLIGADAGRADEAAKNAKIEEMLKLTHVDELTDQLLGQMQPMMDQQMQKMEGQLRDAGVPTEAKEAVQELQTRLMAWIQARLSWERMNPTYVKIYSETLTEEELDGAIAYYRTQAGQSMIRKMPLLMQKSMSSMGNLLSDLVPEMMKITEEIEKKYKKQ
jgi:uncharacterized protein